MNRLDRLIGYFFPQMFARRMYSRARAAAYLQAGQIVGRKYEGASKADRLSMWRATSTSANVEIRGAQHILRDRARDLRRNNPYAARAIQVISTNVIGDGIRPLFNHEDSQQAKALKIANDKWSQWAESTQCDYEGRLNLYQMQSLVLEAVVESGEIFIIRNRSTLSDKKQVPLKLQILECDYLDWSKNEKLSNGNIISQGIEFNPAGEVVNYYFFKSHPGEIHTINQFGFETIQVPSERVIHVFRKDRPHQRRGVTWFAQVMVLLHDFDLLQDATLRKQQIAACFSAFIHDPTTGPQDPMTAKKEIEILEKLDSGSIEILPDGKQITFASPPSAADYPEFSKAILRAVCAGLGLTYESVTNDLSQVNFSSGRMGFIEMNRNVRHWQSSIMCSGFMDKVFDWWIEAVDFITPANVDMTKLWPHWTRPAREMIDPSKEVPAAGDSIASGQTTLSEVLRSRGLDPDTVFNERAGELKKLDDLKIVTTSDPRQKLLKSSPKGNAENGNADNQSQNS